MTSKPNFVPSRRQSTLFERYLRTYGSRLKRKREGRVGMSLSIIHTAQSDLRAFPFPHGRAVSEFADRSTYYHGGDGGDGGLGP